MVLAVILGFARVLYARVPTRSVFTVHVVKFRKYSLSSILKSMPTAEPNPFKSCGVRSNTHTDTNFRLKNILV